jgi:RepB DNA-primase from phage plasmid
MLEWDFFEQLFRGTHGYITLSAIHPDGQHPSPSRHIPVSDQALLANAVQALQGANQQGWGAYVSLATRQRDLGRWRRGGRNDLADLGAVFVDLDCVADEALGRLSQRDPPPSCVVKSGWGVHAYWWLSQPSHDWLTLERALQRLRHDLQGDRTSVVQCLRLPNTINTKPDRQRAVCQIVHLTHDRYPLQHFPTHLPHTTVSLPHRLSINVPASQHADLIEQVCQRLLADGGYWQRNGWLASRCPYPHQHDCPGQHFAFQPQGGFGVCLGKHGTISLGELCQHFSISISEGNFTPQKGST